MPHVDLPQGRIDYAERGEGRPVIFVHGYLMAGDLWSGVAERLAAHGMRCMAPTWPLGAHRNPLAPGADASPRGVAAMIAAFAEALDLRDAILVGNDSGGALCQLVVTRHPERIAGLVLTNCDAFETFPPPPFSLLPAAAKVPGLLRAVVGALRIPAVRRSSLGFGLLSQAGVDDLAKEWVRPPREDRRVLRDLVRFTRSVDKRDLIAAGRDLHRFEGPVLIVWGTEDRVFKLALGERLRDAFSDARLVTLRARCLVMLDRPEELAREIAAFAAGFAQSGRCSPHVAPTAPTHRRDDPDPARRLVDRDRGVTDLDKTARR